MQFQQRLNIMAKSNSSTKRTIKYLATTRNPRIQQQILKSSPATVIKSICNAALNAQRGEVRLTQAEKRLLAKHRALIDELVDQARPLESKRKSLVRNAAQNQKGKGLVALLPILLSTVLSTLGSGFLSNKN